MKTRLLPAVEKRVETGPVKFGEDWTGLFIRGDNAAVYAMHLRYVLEHERFISWIARNTIEGLLDDLESSNERTHPNGEPVK